MLKLLLSMVVWVASPAGQKPNTHLGCQILLTTVKSLGREGRVVFFGGLNVSSKALRLLRQNRRADYLRELARSEDVDFQFEPLLKFRRAFDGSLADQREINHAEIQRLYPNFLPRAPYPGVVLAPEGDADLRGWLDEHHRGWRRTGAYVVKASEPMRLFGTQGRERKDYPKDSYVLIEDSLAVAAFEGPKPKVTKIIELEPEPEIVGDQPLVFGVSRRHRLWSRLRGSF